MKTMKKILLTFLMAICLFTTQAQDTTKHKAPAISFIPYITLKENVYNQETINRYQFNPTIGITVLVKNFDLKAFYGTTFSTTDNYSKQLGASVGGVTATYHVYKHDFKNFNLSPYVTCRLNIYDLQHFGYNPAMGLSLGHGQYNVRIFDGLNFRNNKFTDVNTPKSGGTTDTYNLIAANVYGISLTYNFKSLNK